MIIEFGKPILYKISIQSHHQRGLRAIWRRSKERRSGKEKASGCKSSQGDGLLLELDWKQSESVEDCGAGQKRKWSSQGSWRHLSLSGIPRLKSFWGSPLRSHGLSSSFSKLSNHCKKMNSSTHLIWLSLLLFWDIKPRCWWTDAFCWTWFWGRSSGAPSTLSSVASLSSTFSRQKPFMELFIKQSVITDLDTKLVWHNAWPILT